MGLVKGCSSASVKGSTHSGSLRRLNRIRYGECSAQGLDLSRGPIDAVAVLTEEGPVAGEHRGSEMCLFDPKA